MINSLVELGKFYIYIYIIENTENTSEENLIRDNDRLK